MSDNGERFITRASVRANEVEVMTVTGELRTRPMTADERRAYIAADQADPYYAQDPHSCLD